MERPYPLDGICENCDEAAADFGWLVDDGIDYGWCCEWCWDLAIMREWDRAQKA